jgi:hypothetical protein
MSVVSKCKQLSSYNLQLECQCPYVELDGKEYVKCVSKSRLWLPRRSTTRLRLRHKGEDQI